MPAGTNGDPCIGIGRKFEIITKVLTGMSQYWDLTTKEKLAEGLPRYMPMTLWEFMDTFLRDRPCQNPPHARDFFRANNHVYNSVDNGDHDEEMQTDVDTNAANGIAIGAENAATSATSHPVGNWSDTTMFYGNSRVQVPTNQ